MDCTLCSEKNVPAEHFTTEKHMKNKALQEYAAAKKEFSENRDGIIVSCKVRSAQGVLSNNCVQQRITASAKPAQEVTLVFTVLNDNQKDVVHINFVQMIHSKSYFTLNNQGMDSGCKPVCIQPKKKLMREVTVTFRSTDIGQYEAPIIFMFNKGSPNKPIVIMRDMVIYVQESLAIYDKDNSPYNLEKVMAEQLFKAKSSRFHGDTFPIPKNYKKIFACALDMKDDATDAEKEMAADLRKTFSDGVTVDNYVRFFHSLLWYEETIARINLKKYNMTERTLVHETQKTFSIVVPGLAEKRPSLILGDKLFLKPHGTEEIMFEAVIAEINENVAQLKSFHDSFYTYYKPDMKFDVRFFMSRLPLERMHTAVNNAWSTGSQPRVFPQKNKKVVTLQPIHSYYNPLVGSNPEQRTAVLHIVSGTAGAAPFLLHGPPGTGKTLTLVEAALQLINKDPGNRILICTDSNMAADHVATVLIKYADKFADQKFLLRASSEFRTWESFPQCLHRYSNGTDRRSWHRVNLEDFMQHMIVVTTLSHAAKFRNDLVRRGKSRYISHLMIDEAAQASEPACLIPVSGLLAPAGQLVLAGDPLQLGPVCMSQNAKNHGLGLSLMERLKTKCELYSGVQNSNYSVMLRNNYRSDPEILSLPNRLFYEEQLRACAPVDNLSGVDILGERKHSASVMFYGVLSKEQKMGKSPSFFNTMEVEIVQMYVTALIRRHNVRPEDIGIIAPYIRQVYHIKKWLKENNYNTIEVGTVEAYQGKEKRVIIVSTVRANSDLLKLDAKFQLGFLVDDKRFNVALTRAKAKAIFIGNPLCLQKDVKWQMLMQKCRELDTYFGVEWENENRAGQELMDKITPLLQRLEVNN